MRKVAYLTLLLITLTWIVFVTGCSHNELRQKSNANPQDSADLFVNKVIFGMTLEEKVGQMTQVTLAVVSKGSLFNPKIPQSIDNKKLKTALLKYHVGSILNVNQHALSRKHWYQILNKIDSVTKQSRLKIPVIYGIDAIHGVNYTWGATLFPQELGLAATWDTTIVKQAAKITAYETRASGIPWVFSPVLGVGRQPLWPRLYETFGEDTYLTTKMGEMMVKGYQGNDVSNKYKVVCCMKHYMGYSFPLSGKDRTPAWIPENELREYFLPPFAAAVKAGAKTVMINSSSINGVPVHANHHILTDILRGELHFKGFAVSDWEDIKNLYQKYHFVGSEKEAVKVAVMAGVDMSMVPFDFSFYKELIELVKEGQVPMWRINQAVKRILKVKYELGLFKHFDYLIDNYPEFGSDAYKALSLKAAQESITLLKNKNHVLPLPQKGIHVLVTGFAGNSMETLNGGWTYTWQGSKTDTYEKNGMTIFKAIRNKLGGKQVKFVKGTLYNKPYNEKAAIAAAKKADDIILCLGERAYAETPGNINDFYLPDNQVEFAKALAKTGKPVILVLTEGRPRLISKFADKMAGILMAYLPGNQGGQAIADILFGDMNPSGKLPITYPRYPNALENYDITYDQDTIQAYNPQFPFGYGLSYTNFSYSNLRLSATSLSLNSKNPLKVSVDVKNTGKRAGDEVVQMFIGQLYRNGSIIPPVKRLKGFSRISLKPGQQKTVTFNIKASDLSFVNQNLKRTIQPGIFKVYIKNQTEKFKLK